MKTIEIKTDGTVSSFVENALACNQFVDEIEIGIYENDVLVGGAVFDWYNGEPCMMNVAGAGLDVQSVLEAIFTHMFDVVGLSVIVGAVSPANAAGIAFANGLGATNTGANDEYIEDLDLWVMTKAQCNFYVSNV